MRRWLAAASLLLTPGTVVAQELADCNGLRLTDVAAEAGVRMMHESGQVDLYQVPQTIGPNGSYSCSFTTFVSGNAGDV